MIIDFTIEDLLLDSYLQKNFHTPDAMVQWRTPGGLRGWKHTGKISARQTHRPLHDGSGRCFFPAVIGS